MTSSHSGRLSTIRAIAMRRCLAGVVVLISAAYAGHASAADIVVATPDGALAGERSADGIGVFRGVPFAAPPVGDNRWRAPQPVAPWTGTRSARTFGTNCVQNIVPERKPWTSEFMASGAIGEDCLFLNVWVPAGAATAKRPVFVWFHGGGLVEGSGAIPIYDGTSLAKKGIVVVTINYRLGIFGYFAHPELTRASGGQGASNFGYLDQIAALRWVQRSIAAFGGDPANVTIGGQSAGAGSVHALTASPLARGLFVRAIAESGSGVGRAARALSDVELDGARFGDLVRARSLAALRALPPASLVAPLPEGASFRWNAVVDGWVLPAEIDTVFARGQQNDVPTLTGLTADEGSSAPTYGKLAADEFRAQLRSRFGAEADTAAGLYPSDTAERNTASQKASARDQGLVSMHLWAARRARTARTKAYTYYWTHTLPGPDAATYAAFHTSEVPYVFNALTSGRPFTDADRRIAETVSSYWANFIATGDPNGAGLARWPAFDALEARTMEIGDAFAVRPVADASRLALFTSYFERRTTCSDLATQAMPGVTGLFAQPVQAGEFVPPGSSGRLPPGVKALPAFCRVGGTLTPTPASAIGFEVWMPLAGWNGRFQAVGNGGWTGSISYPALARALARGYATASTDTGHRGDSGAFALGQAEKLVDFAWRGVHLTAVQSKAIIKAHYGNGPRYSYWNGCSSGGRQGLKEAQRFPDDFDGIIAGAPANNWVNQKVAHIVVQQAVNRTADSRIPASKYPAIHAAVMQACDRLDGVADGVLEDPRACRFDPAVLACQGPDAPTCLTPAQVQTARTVYAPVTVPATGEVIFPGVLPGAEKSWDVPAGPEPRQTQIDLLKYVVYNDANWDYRTFDLSSGLALARKIDAEGSQTAAIDPNLAPFFNRGGKLLLYHGWADPNIMAVNTIDYYSGVASTLGGVDRVHGSMRLFMVPGMGHCSGGDGPNVFDAVTAMEQWVEQGRAPERIVASRMNGEAVVRTRPLCAYPLVARYSGTGSTDEEANFVCAPR